MLWNGRILREIVIIQRRNFTEIRKKQDLEIVLIMQKCERTLEIKSEYLKLKNF